MRRTVYYPLVLLIATLFLLLTLSSSFSDRLRSLAIGMASPFWSGLHKTQKTSAETLQLSLENQRLHEVLEEVFEWVVSDEGIQEQMEELSRLSEKTKEEKISKEYLIRRKTELQRRIDLHLQSIPAKIIFRDPLSWNQFVWINVGEKENESLGRKLIAVDSPVVVGEVLIGVVEEVERNRSKVRLITDSGLGVSVRTVRGSSQERVFHHMIEALLPLLKEKEGLFSTQEEKELFLKKLLQIQEKLLQEKKEWFLAKGVLQGSAQSFAPLGVHKLKGSGFNYDCRDVEGESRDLKTGSRGNDQESEKIPLIAQGDLMVTSGMDGVFPAGLSVATVAHIFPLKEGAYAYDLEALPLAADLQDLSVVFVMPPLVGGE